MGSTSCTGLSGLSLLLANRSTLMRSIQLEQNHAIYWNPEVNAFIRSCNREQETVSDLLTAQRSSHKWFQPAWS